MLCLFIDETGDQHAKDYLGFSVALINSVYYPLLKKKAHEILDGVSWDREKEFKGAHLFSISKGCPEVEIEQRIVMAGKLIDLNAGTNSRIRFIYGKMKSTNTGEDYLNFLPALIGKGLPKAPKGAGKNLVIVVCDERQDVLQKKLHEEVRFFLELKNYVVLEEVMQVRSTNDTIGLMFADLVGYLVGRVDNISKDIELFEGLNEEEINASSSLRKLKSSSDLIGKIKRLDVYTHLSAKQ